MRPVAKTITITGNKTISTANGATQLTATVWQGSGNDITKTESVTWSSSNESVATVDQTGYVTAKRAGTTTITVTLVSDKTVTASCTVTVENPLRISASNTKLTTSNSSSVLYVYYNNKLVSGSDIKWSVDTRYVSLSNNNGASSTAVVTPVANTGTSGTTITARYQPGNDSSVYYEASVNIVVAFSAYNVATATVYTSSDSYNLDDPDDEGGKSIVSQLESYFNSSSSRYYGVDSVTFSEVTSTYGKLSASTNRTYYVDGTGSYDLADVYFTPTKVGTATFTLTANVYTTSNQRYPEPVACTISFKVTEGTASSGDITYTADIGDNVYFDSSDFEEFWDDHYSRGTLESVRFSVSGGTLRDSDGKTVGTKECYVSARGSQIDLDDVYFEPNSTNSKKAGTIKFSFTATGYARNSNTASTRTGTVTIIYSDSPDDITYTVGTNGSVALKASDFTAAHKQALGTTAPSGMTITFQSVPSNGTLTYTDSSKKNSSEVKLTSSNIKSRSFTTRSSGTNQIGDVTYTGTSGTDTITYTAYSGSTPLFSGKIVFNGAAPAPTNIRVAFASTNGVAATFNQSAFTTANATVMGKTFRIRFTSPANGTLLLNGATTAVGVDIYPSNLSAVSYRPKSGYNGTDSCAFMAYDSVGNLVGSGTVSIVVQGNPTTTTPSTPNTGATSISQFKDVPATAWYRTELADLVSKGIINGTSATTFAPKSNVTYGDALALVCRATGVSAGTATTTHWASGYLAAAVSRGWLSSDVKLDSPISRSAMADLTAKALGIASSSAASPFADSANGYAVALYNTTPKIFTGEEENGKLYFNGSDSLLREQICAVVYRINQYYASISSSQMPDGI